MTSYLFLTHEVCVVFVMMQRVVQREPLSFLLVHCVLLEEEKAPVIKMVSGYLNYCWVFFLLQNNEHENRRGCREFCLKHCLNRCSPCLEEL